MKMSTKARYGLYACVKLTESYNEGYLRISEISNSIKVSDGYLEQIMSLLKKGNIVIALRGAFGGYKLRGDPATITVGEVLRAVEDNLEIVDCISTHCDSSCNCKAFGVWNKLYTHINSYLDSISLKQLIEEEIV